MLIQIRKSLICEGVEEQKLLLQHFVNGTKASPEELQMLAAINAGRIDPTLKDNLIHMNHQNRIVQGHALDIGKDGIDANDIKRNAEAQLALKKYS